MHEEHSSPETDVTLPKRGDQFQFGPHDAPVTATVTRVSRAGVWADLRCVGPGGWTWAKRQKLPFPRSFRPVVAESDEDEVDQDSAVAFVVIHSAVQ